MTSAYCYVKCKIYNVHCTMYNVHGYNIKQSYQYRKAFLSANNPSYLHKYTITIGSSGEQVYT